MSFAAGHPFQQHLSLLEFLLQRGWKPVRDNGRDEIAGLCPFHGDTHPSFYVNRRKQVFYCHGCGRGGGLAGLVHLLHTPDDLPQPIDTPPAELLLEHTYCFYQHQLTRFEKARAYLAQRGIQDRAVIARMRMGYAPGACLAGYLTRLGYSRHQLAARGLMDRQGRDCFFRCLTFPLPEAGNLYGRSLTSGPWRHRFLPGSKGGLYGDIWNGAFPRLILVEGLFDLAALWQAGFDHSAAALGSHLHHRHISHLCQTGVRLIYICFDSDENGSGQRAAHRLSVQLRHAGMEALRVELPCGHDPASFFAAGASAGDFRRYLERARP